MDKLKTLKRTLIIIFSIFAFIAIAIIVLNMVLGNLIEAKLKTALTGKDEKKYEITFDRTTVNIITGNVKIKGFKVTPDSNFFEKYKSGNTVLSGMMKLEVPNFKLLEINVFGFLKTSVISIKGIEFEDASLNYFTGAKQLPDSIIDKTKNLQSKKLNLDSVQLNGIEGLEIGKIDFINCSFEVYNVVKKDTMVSANDLDFELVGFQLTKLEGNENYFRFGLDNIRVELTDEKLIIPGDLYYLSFHKLVLEKKTSSLVIQDMKLYPKMPDLYKMAQKLKYTTEIYNINIEEISILDFNLRDIINEGRVFVKSVNVDGLDLDMQKDKRFPWNYDKRPQLPNHSLRLLKFPLYIGQVNISNSRLYYHEIMEGASEQMKVTLENMNGQINFITSVKDSINTGKPMSINLSTKLMGVAQLDVSINMPLNTPTDEFSFSGSLGQAKLSLFNSALEPAMGIKIDSGYLEKMTFKAKANNFSSTGEMTFIYNNLTANVLKKNEEDKGKFLSFVANTALHTSNPGKNGKLRVAQMSFERVEYKGLGNYLWKTLQTGIVNSLLPTGKNEKKDYKVEKTSGKQSKKEQKTEKKKK